MKKKKLVSAITASIMACSSLIAVNPSASFTPEDEVSTYLKGKTKITGAEQFAWATEKAELTDCYVDEECNITLIERNYPSTISISISPDTNYKDLWDIVREVNPYASGFIDDRPESYYMQTTGCPFVAISSSNKIEDDETFARENITEEQAKLMCEKLSEKGYVKNFSYSGIYFSLTNGYNEDLNIFKVPENKLDSLKKYLDESDIDFTLNVGELYETRRGSYYRVEIIPEIDMSVPERIELSNNIYCETGASLELTVFAESADKIGGETIEMFDTIMGDANTDGELSISDAVAVMQSVVNNDKYKLTAQGAFNADLNGDGITPLDAQKIQMKLLDLE